MPQDYRRYQDFDQRVSELPESSWASLFDEFKLDEEKHQNNSVNRAAEDGRLKLILHWILYDPNYPEPYQEGDIVETLAEISDEYGLDPEQVQVAYDSCLANIRRENTNHGQA